MRRKLIIGAALVAAIAALSVGQAALEARAALQTVEGPMFELDPFWPQPLPDNWVLGTVIGVAVDSRDHVYVVHRPEGIDAMTEGAAEQTPPLAECCVGAPPVIEFDPEGNVANAFGGPVEGADYIWPGSNHGLGIDAMDNVWIGSNGLDSHILQFSRDGEFIRQLGTPEQDQNSLSYEHFYRVAKVAFDNENNEAYVADGYGNRRVAVVDVDSGEIVRFWGAYGNEPDDDFEYTDDRTVGTGWASDVDPQPQFRTPVHCAEPSNDGLIYVCDRPNNRIQVFTRDGEFIQEEFYEPETLGDGSVWEIAFSPDDEQRWIYLADGKNSRIRIIERESLQEISTLGTGGRQPGTFQAIHSIATDSQGNIYVTETYQGRRIHKFVYLGDGQVARHQGAAWPSR